MKDPSENIFFPVILAFLAKNYERIYSIQEIADYFKISTKETNIILEALLQQNFVERFPSYIIVNNNSKSIIKYRITNYGRQHNQELETIRENIPEEYFTQGEEKRKQRKWILGLIIILMLVFAVIISIPFIH